MDELYDDVNLTAFFAENVEKAKPIKYVASKRIKDAAGNPIKWVLHPIPAGKDQELQAECQKPTQVKTGGRAVNLKLLDTEKYNKKLIVASVAYPDLNNRQLQDSYGVMSAEDLLDVMLYGGEYRSLLLKVNEINDADADEAAEIDLAKN